MYKVEILADSLNIVENRLTTFELTYPRIVHSEFMTHRMLSKNTSSSRAIPVEKMIAQVINDPFIPVYWGKNQKGMQAEKELTNEEQAQAEALWLDARLNAVQSVRQMLELGLHKQIANRLLEPWGWITVVCSGTEFNNFFYLRAHPAAQPEIQRLAYMMLQVYKNNTPVLLHPGQWHRPKITQDDFNVVQQGYFESQSDDCVEDVLNKMSVARCARVSYLRQNIETTIQEDIDRADACIKLGEWSPLEHVAQALDTSTRIGNFTGFKQYRKFFDNENYTRVV